MTTLTIAQIARLAQTVDVWHTPRANQGQMIEISYGRSEDGDIIQRIIDHSGPETTYRLVGSAYDEMPVEY